MAGEPLGLVWSCASDQRSRTSSCGPSLARDTLELLARSQAKDLDTYRDAEPDKILHELRTGQLAESRAIPQSPAYYSTVDATMLFLIQLAGYVAWSGDRELARRLRPNVEAALGWMEIFADHDGDGYLDYLGQYGNGVVNQGWKDSGNATVNSDSSLAEPPIALCEVQAYAYHAWRQTAPWLRLVDDPERAQQPDRRAADLRGRFDRDFWSDELGCYILARQAGGRPAAVVASNVGQVLWGSIATEARAAQVVERLLASDMLSGWCVEEVGQGPVPDPVACSPQAWAAGALPPPIHALEPLGHPRSSSQPRRVCLSADVGFSFCLIESEVNYPVIHTRDRLGG